ncbi:hypothetical protein BH10PLA1_BH10PLA1_22390 [soil metagenome]
MNPKRIIAWTVWILIAAWAAGGLPRLRVSNSLEAWMPDLATPTQFRTYAVVGFPTSKVDASLVAGRLRQLPDVAFCIDPVSVGLTQQLTGVTAEDFVVSHDGSYSGVFCFARDTADPHDFLRHVIDALQKIAPPDTFAFGGPVAFQNAMDEWSQDRLPVISVAILIAGGLTLLAVTRSVRISVAAIAAISLSQIIYIGTVCRLNIPLDMSLALVPPMMTGMGCSYAAHRALRRKSLVLLITCGLAAVAGIASYATADLKPVRYFALAGVPGLILVWLVVVTLIGPDSHARRRRVSSMRRLRNLTMAFIERFPKLIVVTSITVTVASLFLAPRLIVQSNPLRFFPSNSRVTLDFAALNAELTGMLPSQVVVAGNVDAAPVLRATPGLRKVLDVTPWNRGPGRTFLCLADNDAVESLADALPRWQQWAADHGTTLVWSGVAAQIHRSGISIRRLSLGAIPSMAVIMGLLVLLLFRRWRLAVLAVWVALLPVCGLIVVAVALSWKLDPVTLVIGSITTGVAVDDLIHLTSTALRRRSMKRAIIECWRPCVGSSLAASMCFGLFIFSRFEPTAQFGLFMAIATFFAMLSNQLLLPSAIFLGGIGRGKVNRPPVSN